MSKHNVSTNNVVRNTRTTREVRDSQRAVYDPTEYVDGTYERTHSLSNMSMSIRREDTRHGGTSEVVISRTPNKSVAMTLSEARSLLAFLNRELSVRAR